MYFHLDQNHVTAHEKSLQLITKLCSPLSPTCLVIAILLWPLSLLTKLIHLRTNIDWKFGRCSQWSVMTAYVYSLKGKRMNKTFWRWGCLWVLGDAVLNLIAFCTKMFDLFRKTQQLLQTSPNSLWLPMNGQTGFMILWTKETVQHPGHFQLQVICSFGRMVGA